jgi:hypothetical protein
LHYLDRQEGRRAEQIAKVKGFEVVAELLSFNAEGKIHNIMLVSD